MKTRMTRTLLLALTVVLALALFCLPACAAEGSAPPLQTVTGDQGQTVHFRVDDDGKVTVLDDVSEDSLLLAAYWNGPQFLGAKELKVGDVSAQTISDWNRIKLFWLDKQAKPVAPAPVVKAKPCLARTITSGIPDWSELTSRSSVNYYVADSFAKNSAGMESTEYYLNGMRCTSDEVKNAAARRGTVTEFYTDANGDIYMVKAYSYAVDLVEGDVATKTLSDGTVQVRVPGVISGYVDADKVTGWEGLKDGDVVLYYKAMPEGSGSLTDLNWTIEKAEKVTGKVSSFSTDGYLTVNGTRYRGSEQQYAGNVGDVFFKDQGSGNADEVFGRWTESYSLTDEYDFYLDKNGSIVAGFQRTGVDRDMVCMVLGTEVTDAGLGAPGALWANLLFLDGSTEIVNVSKVAAAGTGYALMDVVDTVRAGNEDRQIKTSDAQKAIAGTRDAAVTQKFFNYLETAEGYELIEVNSKQNARFWEDPVTLGDGTATVATIQKTPMFAQAVGGAGSLAGWNITADSLTTFLVGKRSSFDGAVVYTVYKGFREVPEMDAARITAICANFDPANPFAVNTVAKFVYLETKVAGEAPPDEPEGESRVGMVLEAEVWEAGLGIDGALRANLLFEDGTTEIVNVYKVDGLVVTDTVRRPDDQISTTDAYARVVGARGAAAMTKFFRCAPTASGYVLAELNAAKDPDNWEDPASCSSTAAVATIRKSPVFAQAVGGAGGLAGWNITADADTTFLVGERSDFDGTVAYTVCKGFQNVPEVDVTRMAAICANTTADSTAVNTVAKYVYLETEVPGEAPPDEPEGESRVGMVLEAEVSDAALGTDGVLRAKLLFMDGTTEVVTVCKVDGRIVTDTVRRPDDQISTTDAYARIVGARGAAALTKFFRCAPTASGYVLAELNAANDPENWEDPASCSGMSKVAAIWKEASFAKEPGDTSGDQTLAGWNITADAETTFVVGKVNANDGSVTYLVYKGYRDVPEMDAARITAICANFDPANPFAVNTVAKYVYLETDSFKGEVPDGYIFIRDNSWMHDPEMAEDEVCLVHIVDTDGTSADMRVPMDLVRAISNESMILERPRTYVGNFWAVGVIDEYGVVSSLTNGGNPPVSGRPVSLGALESMGNDVIAINYGGAVDYYAYDNYTKFVYVDMGWIDGRQPDNRIGVREEDKDEVYFAAAGTFDPENFFDANDVSQKEPDGTTYKSVEVAVICQANSDTADYVYVVRNLW